MSYTFTLLNSSMSIGDSVDIINDNYNNLESWIGSIKLSSDEYWSPFVDFYKSYILELLPNVTSANSSLGNWKSTASTVETNSSKWIEPLIIYYPKIIYESEYIKTTISNTNTIRYDLTSTKLTDVTNWLNYNFQVLNNNNVMYVENSEAIVHLILNINDIQVSNHQISDSTTCSTSDTIATGVCTVKTSGTVTSCNKKSYHCGGSFSCNKSQNISCNFENNSKLISKKITANLKYNFDNNHEIDKILRLKYIVKNCMWEYITSV